MEELFLKTNDNIKIAINHHFSNNDSVIIIVHGWFMCKDSKPFLEMAEALSKSFDVISMDCRGHGRSTGKYTFTVEEGEDLKTVVEFAKKIYKNVFFMGFSLGAALVLLHGANADAIKGIIAVSPPARFEKIENRFWHPNAWIPTLQKFEPTTWLSIRPDFYKLIFKTKIPPTESIENLKTPVLFISGENDPTVLAWHTEELFEKAKCPKKYKKIKNGLHAEDLFLQDKDKFVNLCCNWISNALESL